ncbi:hypothetical protein P3342_013443 [Pyrenophora teres f. teres]|nr:hypothetical protein P3342_013443 [Pyrenophora teres f. teres]
MRRKSVCFSKVPTRLKQLFDSLSMERWMCSLRVYFASEIVCFNSRVRLLLHPSRHYVRGISEGLPRTPVSAEEFGKRGISNSTRYGDAVVPIDDTCSIAFIVD